jgi:hypothetical protein
MVSHEAETLTDWAVAEAEADGGAPTGKTRPDYGAMVWHGALTTTLPKTSKPTGSSPKN